MSQEKLLAYVDQSDAALEVAAKYSLLLSSAAVLVACFVNLI